VAVVVAVVVAGRFNRQSNCSDPMIICQCLQSAYKAVFTFPLCACENKSEARIAITNRSNVVATWALHIERPSLRGMFVQGAKRYAVLKNILANKFLQSVLCALISVYGLSGALSADVLAQETNARGVVTSRMIHGAAQQLLPITSQSVNQSRKLQTNQRDRVPGQIVFKLRSALNQAVDVPPLSRRLLDQERNAMKTTAERNHKIASARSVFRQAKREKLKRIYKTVVSDPGMLDQVLAEMNADPNIEWAESNYLAYTQSTFPNDPDYFNVVRRNLSSLNLEIAWDTSTGSADVVVAIIDTGVNYNHEDLKQNIWINAGEIPDDGLDNDGNGFIDDTRGWDFVSVPANDVASGEDPGPPDNDPMDFFGHGTHVAGIVGAEGNNGIGVTGVAWDVSLMVLRAGYKTSSNQGALPNTDTSQALYYACDNGAHIVNMSYGGPYPSSLTRAAMDYCTEKGVLLVAAAGNSASSTPIYPASFDNVFSVASLDYNDWAKSSFSTYGTWVDIAAPGSNVYSTLLNGGYGYMSGTSMASPIVAGVAALLKSANPDLTAIELAQHLLVSATELHSSEPQFFRKLGAGRVSADLVTPTATLPVKLGIVSLHYEELEGMEDDAFDVGEVINLTPSVRNFSTENEDVTVSLTSSDLYLSLVDVNSAIGAVAPNIKVTPTSDILQMEVLPGVPENHIAHYTLTLSNSDGTVSTEPGSVKLNPIFRNHVLHNYLPTQAGFLNPRIAEHPDGSLSLVFASQGDTPIYNRLYHRIRSAEGIWQPISTITDEGLAQSNHSIAVADSGKLHVVFNLSEGIWNSEVFHAVYNPDTAVWLTTKLTEGAGINVESVNDFSPEATILVDSLDNPLVAWSDERDILGDIYTASYNGAEWQAEELSLDLNARIYDLQGYFVAEDKPVLIWREIDLDNNQGPAYFSSRDSSGWSTPAQIVPSGISRFKTTLDSVNNIHLVYHPAGSNAIYYTRFDGTAWTLPALVLGEGLWLNLVSVTVSNTGNPEIHVYRDKQLYKLSFNGLTWSELRLIYQNDRISETPVSLIKTLDGETQVSFHNYIEGNWFVWTMDTERNESLFPTRPLVDTALFNNNQIISSNSFSEHQQGIWGYKMSVGTVPGIDDLLPWTTYWSSSPSFGFTPSRVRPFLAGQAYYMNIQAHGNAGYTAPVGVGSPQFPTINLPPEVSITAPADALSFVVGTTVTLKGTATDFPDGDISSEIYWYSDIDGYVGRGAEVQTNSLSEASHVISASANDSLNFIGTNSINLTIEPVEVVYQQHPVSIVGIGANPNRGNSLIDQLGDGTQNLTTSWGNAGDQSTAWFTLDLGSEKLVDSLQLALRENRNYTLYIYVGNELDNGQVIAQTTGQCSINTGPEPALQKCSFPPGNGRYVTVKLVSGSWLKLYGVEVWGEGPGESELENELPVAAFTATTSPESLNVVFDATSSYDPDGELVSYSWDFGDAGTTTGITTNHTYATSNTYAVTLTITDNDEASDEISKVISVSIEAAEVTRLPVTVAAVGARASRANNLIDELADTSQNLDSAWLNDGSAATAWFTLELSSTQLINEIKIGPRGNRSYTLDVYVGTALIDGKVVGSPAATCTPATGSSTIPAQLQSCPFAQTLGRYITVRLTSGSWIKIYGIEVWGGGASGSGDENEPPTAEFTVTTYPGSLIVDFDASASSDSDGTLVNYTWDFGDGNSDTGITTSHLYPAGSTYPVTLTVVDNDDEPDDITKNVAVSLEIGESTKLPVVVDGVGARASKADNLTDVLSDGSQDLSSNWRNDGIAANAWFTLDLGSVQLVDELKLGPRSNRAYTLDIYVGDTLSNGQVNAAPVTTCSTIAGSSAVPASLQSCSFSKITGRYVTVKLASSSWLKFYGVEVWGTGP